MRVEHIMTRKVVAVAPDTSIHDAARLLVEHGVSGLPVVDAAGAVVGILSEGDLIVRQTPRTHVPWWRLFFTEGERMAREYQKAVGTTVAEVMTRAVICVTPDLAVESVAAILGEHRIRRVPVVENGRLVGIVSRGDLVKALAATTTTEPGPPRPDAQLVAEMKKRLAAEPWVSNRGIVIDAHDAVLSLWGVVASEVEKGAVETMARSIPGARGIDSHLMVRADIPYAYGI